MTNDDYFVSRIKSLEELTGLKEGTEIIYVHDSGSGSGDFTVHGKFVKPSSTTHLELDGCLKIPVSLQVNEVEPYRLMNFLRDLSDSRYPRKDGQIIKHFDGPSKTNEFYLVHKP